MTVAIGTVCVLFNLSCHVTVTMTVLALATGLSVATVTVLVYLVPSAAVTGVAASVAILVYANVLIVSNFCSATDTADVKCWEELLPLTAMT